MDAAKLSKFIKNVSHKITYSGEFPLETIRCAMCFVMMMHYVINGTSKCNKQALKPKFVIPDAKWGKKSSSHFLILSSYYCP